MTSELGLDRLEFQEVKIRANSKAKSVTESHVPQLRIDFEKYNLYHRSRIAFPDSEVDDPRHFAFTYGVKLESKADELMPYEIEVEAMALLNYKGDELKGAERFRAVRLSGYQMLHGAIREMVANVTARSRHGLLQIPSRNFNGLAKREADEDEAGRVAHAVQIKGGDTKGLTATDVVPKKVTRTRSAVPEKEEAASLPKKRPAATKRKPKTDS